MQEFLKHLLLLQLGLCICLDIYFDYCSNVLIKCLSTSTSTNASTQQMLESTSKHNALYFVLEAFTLLKHLRLWLSTFPSTSGSASSI